MNHLRQLRDLLVMAAADGSLTEREIKFLSSRCAKWGITDQEFAAAIQDALRPDAELSFPKDRHDQREILAEMIRMMAADGDLAEVEKELFATAAACLGFSDDELKQLIDSVLPQK